MSFLTAPTYSDSYQHTNMAVGDFNGDGLLDVAVNEGGNSTASVRILLGNGDGTFRAGQGYLTAGSAFLLATDLDGDGRLDLVVAGYGGVSILLGNGDGTFRAGPTYNIGNTVSVAVGDFNDDGIPDLALTLSNYQMTQVSILLGRGDGTFQDASLISTQSVPFENDIVTVGDFNGDGSSDLAVTNWDESRIMVLLGKGDGTFQDPVFYAVGAYPSALAVADVNGDGISDLAVANSGLGTAYPGPDSVSILLGKGDGTFARAADYVTGYSNDDISSQVGLSVADFDGDGHPDLAVLHGASSTVTLLRGNGDGTFRIPPVGSVVGYRPSALAVGDFNSDGHPDLIVANAIPFSSSSRSNTLSILLGNGDGTFQGAQTYTAELNPTSVAVGDFNVDNAVDLAVANSGSSTISILLGNGHGGFEFAHSYAVGTQPDSVAVADFNADGIPDLVVANFGSNSVSVLLGNGDGTFRAAQMYPVGSNPTSVTVADFNSDGSPDLAVTNAGSRYGIGTGSMSILLGNADGTFQPAQNYAVPYDDPVSVSAGDFNADGVLDLVVDCRGIPSYSSSALSILLGKGDGSFEPGRSFSAGLGPQAVAVGDFNGDGKLDLATANYGELRGAHNVLYPAETDLRVYLGNGDGTFQPAKVYDVGLYPRSVAVADVNGDGIADLVVTNHWDNMVAVLLGNGNGTFQPVQSYTAGGGPLSLAVADFNGDGYPDLAVADNVSIGLPGDVAPGTVTVLLNAADWSGGHAAVPHGPIRSHLTAGQHLRSASVEALGAMAPWQSFRLLSEMPSYQQPGLVEQLPLLASVEPTFQSDSNWTPFPAWKRTPSADTAAGRPGRDDWFNGLVENKDW